MTAKRARTKKVISENIRELMNSGRARTSPPPQPKPAAKPPKRARR